ncbi:MAG TPA: ABC transporter permease [Thermoanaerobaculia bacterium]|nr:ABC transporter permease [Thermoanaerobaculia bacterium]
MSPRPFRFLSRTRREIEGEVEEEIRFHLAALARALERQGWTPREAREEARRRFGDLRATRAACVASDLRREKQMQRRETLDEMAQDLRHSARELRRRPLFTGAAVLTLAIGVGATTAIFSAADHVLLRPLPYREADRVMTLWETDRAAGELKKEVASGNFLSWRERSRSFAALGLAEPFGFDLTGDGPPEPATAWRVTEEFFAALGVEPVLGRSFAPEDYAVEADPAAPPRAVLLSYGLWQRRYGADPAILGRQIQLDGQGVPIVGVLPPWLEYPDDRDLWAPKVFPPFQLQERASGYMPAVGRLRPGVTRAAAQAELDGIAAALGVEHPGTNAGAGVNLVPLQEQVLGSVRPALLVLLGAVALLLLIACANVAGLLLARGTERSRELGVRAAIGAGRGRLARQLLTESVLLSGLGGAAGLLVAFGGVRLLARIVPPDLPRAGAIAVDARILAFALGVTLLTAVLCGVGPALRLSRPDLLSALGGGGRGAGPGPASTRLRNALVVTEVAFALVLLIGAGLLGRSFVRLLDNDLGFRAERRAAVQLFLWDRNPTAEQRRQRVAQLAARFSSVPDVEEVAVVSALPLHPHQIDPQDELIREDRPGPRPGESALVYTTVASPNYFRLMGIPLRGGRELGERDRSDAPAVAIVNQALAGRFFPGEDPVGKRVTFGVMGRPVSREIVGVVANVRPTALDSDPRPEVYVPFEQSAIGSVTFVVRTRTEAAAMLPVLRALVWQVDADQSVYHLATVDRLLSDTLVGRRFNLQLLAAFSAVALALATLGIYGLISFLASQRRHEIGVRMALGARRGDIVGMIVRQGLGLGVPGVALGVLGALALTRFLRHLLYGVTPTDPVAFVGLSVLLLIVTAAGAYLPARRAAGADPGRVLRQE